MTAKHNIKTHGFTLVELSIVLVIIGLVVGGILTGQDMLRSAAVRNQITQVSEIETKINTFKVKYSCLPGDCGNATSFFGTTDAAGYTVVNGDDNGIIRATNSGATVYTDGECLYPDVTAEVSQLLLHLNDAGLANYTATGNSTNASGRLGTHYPYTAFGNNTGIFVTCLASLIRPNYTPRFLRSGNVMVIGAGNLGYRIGYSVGSFGMVLYSAFGNNGVPSAGNNTNAGLPMEAIMQIDVKTDDGLPNSGKFGVIAAESSTCGASNANGNTLSAYPTSLSTYSTCLGTAGKLITP